MLKELLAPPQIMFDLSNYKFCPLLTLSISLVVHHSVDTNKNDQLTLFVVISPTATWVKQKISRYLKKIFMSEEFGTMMKLFDEIVGIHSVLKFASTHVRRSGCSKDNLNIKGRWERIQQMVCYLWVSCNPNRWNRKLWGNR